MIPYMAIFIVYMGAGGNPLLLSYRCMGSLIFSTYHQENIWEPGNQAKSAAQYYVAMQK